VDPDLFDRVQAAFGKRTNGRFSNRDFLFSRLITCGECGHAVTAEIKKEKYVYYHCTGYGNKHKRVYVPEAALDREFAGIVGRVTLPFDWYDYLKTCLEHELGHRRIRIARERERLETLRDQYPDQHEKGFPGEAGRPCERRFLQGSAQ
jgi:hypothetical protein